MTNYYWKSESEYDTFTRESEARFTDYKECYEAMRQAMFADLNCMDNDLWEQFFNNNVEAEVGTEIHYTKDKISVSGYCDTDYTICEEEDITNKIQLTAEQKAVADEYILMLRKMRNMGIRVIVDAETDTSYFLNEKNGYTLKPCGDKYDDNALEYLYSAEKEDSPIDFWFGINDVIWSVQEKSK